MYVSGPAIRPAVIPRPNMTSNRKRRFSEFDDSHSLGHDSREKRRRREEVYFSRAIIELVVTATGLMVAGHLIRALAVKEDVVEVHASNVVV